MSVPPQTSGDMFGDFGREVLFPRLRLFFWNVEEQASLRAVGLTEMPPPVQSAGFCGLRGMAS